MAIKIDEKKLEKALPKSSFSRRRYPPHASLNRPCYRRTSAYGHFGRAPYNDGGFSLGKTDG